MRVESLRTLLCLLLLWGCADVEPHDDPPRQLEEAATVPSRFTDTKLVEGLASPTAMAIAPDGRIFVCEQAGKLRLIENGKLLPEPFLAVETNTSGERGLLGVALDPSFPSQPYVYVYYTATAPYLHNRVSRFTASGNRAVAGSERVLLDLERVGATIHNGGALHFGADGRLYVAVGDNSNPGEAQRLDKLMGKLLRLEKDGSIPANNPFSTHTTGVYRAIWALGLRNPFSFAVQPGTGRLFINDVGQSNWEEINEGVAGANYGWPNTEGHTNDSRYRGPLFSYSHGSGNERGCAITAGTFYNPPLAQFPSEYVGLYFFSDYCNGWLRTYNPKDGTTRVFATGLLAPVDLDVGLDGGIYYLDRGDNSVHRIRYTAANEAPTLVRQPESQTVRTGQPATFTVSATGTPPLRYQWQRNGNDMPGQTSANLTLAAVGLTDSGSRFRVRVSNDSGSVMSNEAVLTVRNNTAPVATLVLPTTGTRYGGGDVITFEGMGTDAEDGVLRASAFSWRVDFHHDDHLHPFLPTISGMSRGAFTVPDRGETSATVWYRIHLQVTDAGGATHAVYRDVHPRTVKLEMDTQPAGLQVTLDGQPQTTPLAVMGVVGMVRTLGVVSPQVKDGTTYVFERWSHGEGATHEHPTPATDARCTAIYRPVLDPPPGNGLRAEYFDAPDFTQLKVERVDPTVDFRWEDTPPAPSVAKDTFSVRWTGSVVPRYSETYTFYTQSNDGVRLWVDGKLLINDWNIHNTVENRGTVTLQAGRAHSLRLEFFENKGVALMRLHWSSPSQRKQLIPTERLRPTPP